MSKFLAFALALLFLSTPAFAVGPIGVTGQNQSPNKYPSVIKTPNNQVTDLGASSVLLETGNKNILQNPSFEAPYNVGHPGWTVTNLGGVTASTETLTVIDGKQSVFLSPGSLALDMRQDSTLYAAQFADGVQGLAYIRVKNSVTSSPIYVCPRTAGAYPAQMSSGCVQVRSDSKWGLYKVPFILGGTSNGIGITSNGVGVSGNIYVDDAFVGAVDLKVDSNPVGPWVDYGAMTIGATTTAPTKATTREYDKVRCRINGQDYECEYLYRASSATGAAVGSGVYVWSLPTGVVMDSSVPLSTNTTGAFAYSGTHAVGSIGYGDMEYSGNGDTGTKCDLFATSTTTFQAACFFGGTGVLQPSSTNAAINNTDYSFRWHVKFRGAGLSSNYSSYSTTNADTDWADCGITGASIVGLGSSVPTPSLQCKRQGGDLLMKGKLTAGTTPTATEARIPLPLWNGVQLTSASTTKIPSIQIAGLAVVGAQSSTVFHASTLIEPSVAYITLGYQTSTTNALTKVNGNFLIGSGQTLSIEARIPIDGWDNSNIIIGQFNGLESCANSAQCETEYYADISAAAAVSGQEITFISGCTLSTNTFTCTYSTPFAQTPMCEITPGAGATQAQKTAESASSISYVIYNATGTPTNVAHSISCRKRGSDYVTKTARAVSSDQNIATPGVTKAVLASAVISTTGVKSQDDSTMLSGNCVTSGSQTFTCPFTTNFWASAPKCWAEPTANTAWESNQASVSTSQVVFNTASNAGAGLFGSFNLFCHGQKP